MHRLAHTLYATLFQKRFQLGEGFDLVVGNDLGVGETALGIDPHRGDARVFPPRMSEVRLSPTMTAFLGSKSGIRAKQASKNSFAGLLKPSS